MKIKKRQLITFVTLLLTSNYSLLTNSMEQTLSEKISDGTLYKHSFIEKPTKASIHIIEIDPKKINIQSKVALDRCVSLIPTSIMSKEIKAIAAINAGYSDDLGIPAGILKVDGIWFSDQKNARAAFGFDVKKNIFLIDIVYTKTFVTFENTVISVERINQQRKESENILYLPTFGKKTFKNKDTINFVVNNKKLIGILSGSEEIEVPKDGFILSVFFKEKNKEALSSIKIEMLASFSTEIIPEEQYANDIWNTIPNIIGGIPMIVKNEKIITNFEKENVWESFLKARFARTAVGIKKDGTILFLVVDNKGLLNNRGMTIPELAKLMLDLECTDALSFSGGKSSTCFVKNKVVSCSLGDLSFGGIINIEKPISDILGVICE